VESNDSSRDGHRRAAAAVGAAAALGGAVALVQSYRGHLTAATERLADVDRRSVHTAYGVVEYADHGEGEPVLVSHGIFHGCDGGWLSVRDILPGRRVVVPSRFGYLGSDMPPGATVADQSDAFVALLDALGLERVDVVAVSAGTGAALLTSLRHPDRVGRLVVSSGNFPGSGTAQAPPGWARVFYSDPAMWLMRTLARPAFARLMGVPDGFPRGPGDARVMATMLDSIFPVGPRSAGAVFDAYVANPEVGDYPLEAMTTPTLVVHAQDDPLASYDAAVAAAERIPGASLVGLDSGGHLQLGQTERVRREVAAFLSTALTDTIEGLRPASHRAR
jgi:pimeloyl-ACP methyl ester carboxylesterase